MADRQGQGKLKIYLGYAAGVGKTYQMLEEAQVMQCQGKDVVIGYFEPHGRKDTIAKTETLKSYRAARSLIAAQCLKRWIRTPSSNVTPPCAL